MGTPSIAPAWRLARLCLFAFVGVGPASPSPARAEPADERLAVDVRGGRAGSRPRLVPGRRMPRTHGRERRTAPARGARARVEGSSRRKARSRASRSRGRTACSSSSAGKTRRLVRVLAASTGAERARFAVECGVAAVPDGRRGAASSQDRRRRPSRRSTSATRSLTRRWKITAKEGHRRADPAARRGLRRARRRARALGVRRERADVAEERRTARTRSRSSATSPPPERPLRRPATRARPCGAARSS